MEEKSIPVEFDSRVVLRGLYDAMDERRCAQGMSWAEAARAINGYKTEGVPIATSTIMSLKEKPVGEGDGILGVLVWLGRTPESFVPGVPDADAERYRLPEIKDGQGLRWDTQALHTALNAERQLRRLTWKQAAEEMGGWAPSLQYLAKGGRIGFPSPVMKAALWLGQPAAAFARAADGPFWVDTGEMRPEAKRREMKLSGMRKEKEASR
jgi:hypothetical protein